MSVVQQSRHLGDSEGPDGFDPNGHVQHLRGDEVAVARALQSGQLHQDADVPVGQTHSSEHKLSNGTEQEVEGGEESSGPFKVGDVLVVALAADVDDLGEKFVSVGGSLCFVHVQHQLLHDLHQVLLGHLDGETKM